MGVDPGIANVGVAVVETSPLQVLEAYVVATKKTQSRNRRIVDDDQDRMRTIWVNLTETYTEYKPNALGVEAYTVYKPGQGGQGKGAGWKALYAYVMTITLGFIHDIPVHGFTPKQLKLAIGADPTKAGTDQAVCAQVPNAAEYLAKLSAGSRNHAADAIACALVVASR